MTVPLLPGIAALADRYDGFILDLWGVLHDGQHPLPGAVDALERLHAPGQAHRHPLQRAAPGGRRHPAHRRDRHPPGAL